ncbi:MAG: hypothetical protein R3B54_02830 [Bdellovibrionota bacterium]
MYFSSDRNDCKDLVAKWREQDTSLAKILGQGSGLERYYKETDLQGQVRLLCDILSDLSVKALTNVSTESARGKTGTGKGEQDKHN